MKEKITHNSKEAKEFFQKLNSFLISPFELKDLIDESVDDINIIDVRSYDDYIDGHIPFAIHIPLEQMDEHLVMLHKDKINVVYCASQYCHLGFKAAYCIADRGFPVMLLNGGYKIWEKLDYDTISNSSSPIE